jgi:hypothetical protein
MIAPVALLVLAVSAAAAWRRRHPSKRLPAHAVIVSPRRSTSISRQGEVQSAQSAELTLDSDDLERLWNPANLENLARTYWLFLSRVTLGLIRVVYRSDSRAVVLLFRPLTLLRFDAPEYTLEPDHGAVRWQIRDGLLVAREGRGCGYLALDVRRAGQDERGRARLKIEVEVANFYPSIAAGLSTPVYEMTQSLIHVLVTNGFLRSLAKLDLAKSKVGQLADETGAEDDGAGAPRADGAANGDSPARGAGVQL